MPAFSMAGKFPRQAKKNIVGDLPHITGSRKEAGKTHQKHTAHPHTKSKADPLIPCLTE